MNISVDINQLDLECTCSEKNFEEFWNDVYKESIIKTFGREQPYKEIAYRSFIVSNLSTRQALLEFLKKSYVG